MTFLGLEARTDLPKVSYPTALDFFVFLSFAFIFATILQFAIVHYFTKYGSGECYFNYYESSSESNSEDEEEIFPQSGTMSTSHLSSLSRLSQIDAVDMYGVIPLSRLELDIDQKRKHSKFIENFRKFIARYFFCLPSLSKNAQCRNDSEDSLSESINESEHQFQSEISITQNTPQNNNQRVQKEQIRRSLNSMEKPYRRMFNSVSKVDKVSRVLFPLMFFAVNLIYWAFYLSRSQRK